MVSSSLALPTYLLEFSQSFCSVEFIERDQRHDGKYLRDPSFVGQTTSEVISNFHHLSRSRMSVLFAFIQLWVFKLLFPFALNVFGVGSSRTLHIV